MELFVRRQARHDSSNVASAEKKVQSDLGRLRSRVAGSATREIEILSKSVVKLTDQSKALIDRIENVIDEADRERQKFVYLAGIGLMTEFVFHELERAVSYTLDTISRGALQRPTIQLLKEQLTTLHKRIAAFDELTTEKRQRKSKFELGTLVQSILRHHEREFERHQITKDFTSPRRGLWINAVRGMVIQIIENLIVNSVYWLKQQQGFEAGFHPRIDICIDRETGTLTIEDNGPGVHIDRVEQIFEPFTTTKPVGQGRGLGLYIARELAEYHRWRLHMGDELDKIRQGRVNSFVLEMTDQ